MYSARRSVQAVAFILGSAVYGLPVYSQNTLFLNLETKSLRSSAVTSSAASCQKRSDTSWPALRADISGTFGPSATCDIPVEAVRPVAPCAAASPVNGQCRASHDFVRDDLNTMGKHGHLILRARDKVLEILQSDNACTAWYRTKDSDPAATFRTLTFSLDRDSDEFVQSFVAPSQMQIFRSPYVARVLQGEGAGSTVTINRNGAFFQALASVVLTTREAGPWRLQGVRQLRVGPYDGATFRAQVVTLLHELGHVIDLLPQDSDDETKSPQNTLEVLSHCREEVESKEVPHATLASR